MARLFLIPLLLGSGCDISAKSRAGALITMSMQGVGDLPAGKHLEMWARLASNDVVRVDSIYDVTAPDPADPRKMKAFHSFYGLQIKKAITMGDPCMIDAYGNLLTTPAAYPTDVVVNGVKQTPEEQAAQIRTRIAQLTTESVCDTAMPPHCGHQLKTLYAVLPYDPTETPTVAIDAPAAERLASCQGFWAASPITYTPNPVQVNAPIHGTAFGFVDFITTVPPSAYDQVRLDTPLRLNGLQELWLTLEGDTVDPRNPGPVYLDGAPDDGGREIIHITMRGTGDVVAQVAVNFSLDEDPVQF